ncbi:nucleotide sugar dehydrogenase [Xylanibacillus composti]|uniref:UDP-N-acetyl-D-glucosamine dehydrogenase n=1 Tax=Xylanibacillus composti TaxID=1572762 RepID=A0A8J4H3L7_9BACL|nr:nucleotide sugar dehydrogenase [Xylanibacillus composti]MDT9726202.1 nucleotide sugar dehydrogenase [Xylanibacillus composti]GIQ68048.1 UDP-N-acetyl-D-glucosamine dehydrogenase [Xylanibacillus composti]
MELGDKIRTKQAMVGIVGLGYVGLPLGIAFAQSGFTVVGIDRDPGKVDKLNRGFSYIQDVPEEGIREVAAAGLFQATTEFAAIGSLDVICICVPTPLNKNQEPDLSYVKAVVIELQAYLRPGTLVVLESTTYPGTTEELIGDVLAKNGLYAGSDYHLCYSPERVDPGNKTYTIRNTPKVIGGVTPQCVALADALYRFIVDRTFLVSSPKVAEMSKLLENTFRSVNIAFVNEMALLCDALGINVWEVIQAASTKPFGFMPFYPGPGLGGHCIPLDPMYLSWKAKGENFFSRFIELSQDLNRNMPRYIVNKIAELLNTHGKSIKGSSILLLGMAYKPDVSDLRESPSLDVYELLKGKGARLTVNDPYCDGWPDESEERTEWQKTIHYAELGCYDLIVLLTAHSVYDLPNIADSGVLILDTRNAFGGLDAPNIARIGDVLPEVVEPALVGT